MSDLDFVACQSFAGGLDMGATRAGLQLAHKVEQTGGFGLPNVLGNRHLLGHNWEAQATAPEEWEVVSARTVLGNPPCSGFSVASNQDFRGADSPINSCMWALVKYAARFPDLELVAFESVQPAFTRPDGHALMRRLRVELEYLTGQLWNLHHLKHDVYAIGGVATRRRYFWVASRIPFGVDPTPVSTAPVLWDAIGDLAGLPLTWRSQPHTQTNRASAWLVDRGLLNPSGFVDGMMTDGNPDSPHVRRIIELLETGDWQPGETANEVAKRYYEATGTVPPSWRGHLQQQLKKDWASGFFPTLRWDPDRPGRVIHGGSVNSSVHPTEARTLTHREVARIMGFPDSWLIEPLREVRGAASFWGKGITVQAGEWLGRAVRQALEGDPYDYPGELIGEREWLVDVKPRKIQKTERRDDGDT